MSFFFGKGTKVKPSYTGLQLQTASSTAPITLLWGGNRISMNLFWYDDFKAHKKKQKAGKGMGGSSTYYTYSASIQGGLCEGPIAGVGRVFKDDEKTTLAKLGMSLFLGTYPQAPWGYLTSAHPTKALNYEGVAYVAIANYDLGTSASLGNHTFEVFGREYNTAPNGHDCDCAILVKDFLTNPQYGAGFGLSRLDQDQLFSTAAAPTTGDSSYQTYCTAMGFGLSPMLSDAQEAGTILAQWALLTNTAIVWNGYKLKMVPYVRETVTGNGVTYIPPQLSEPAYTITDQDLMADPEIERVDQSDCPNVVTLNINNRFNEYNELPVPYKDQTLIDQFGERKGNDIDAPEVTDPDMAAEMVSLICARGAYIRNNYTIKLGQEYVLLEPMDTLVLVNANGFQVLLQITNIEEDDDFVFTLECEEIANNISSTGGFTNPETSTPTIIDSGVVASPVNPPIIFEPAANLTNGIAQIWCAVSGGDGTTADPNWGGCEVYVSLDDITYQSIGIIDSPARQGKLTAAMSSSALAMASVDMSMSGGELQSVTALEQLQGATLSIIENELITYQGANLTGTNLYNLTLTNRGLYSTSAAAHPIGSRFARLDENVFKYDLPANYIGQVLYLKFQSFNIWNQGYQDMEDVVAYVYTPDGKGFQVAPPTSATLSFNSTTQSDGTTILQGVVVAGASTGPYLDHYDVQVTTDGGTTWTDIAAISASGTRTTFQPATPSTNYKARIRAVSSAVGGIPSNWVESAIVNSGALGGTVPNVPTGLTGTGGVLSNTMSWVAPASGSPATKYNVYGKVGHSGALTDATLVGSVGYGVLSFTHVGLNASEDWRYWVKSANGAGESVAAAGPIDLTTSASGGGGGGSLEVLLNGVSTVAVATALNFEGDGVDVVEDPSGTAKITITGGGGGSGSSAAEIVYLCVPNFRPGNITSFGNGNFGGRAVTVTDDCQITHISGYCGTANASSVVRPAIYSKDPTTGAPATLLVSGPQLTGVPQGVVDLPLTTPYQAVAGEEIYIGWQVLTSNLGMATVTAHATFFFSASGSLPSTAPSATYDSGGSMCLFIKAIKSGAGGVARATAKNWRIRAVNQNPANSSGSTVGVGELEFRDSNGTNIATGGTAIASTVNGGSYPASNAFDGNLTTAWYSQNNRNIGEWIGYTFASAVTLYSIRIYPTPGFPEGTAREWVVECSDDGINWDQVTVIRTEVWVNGAWQVFTIPPLTLAGSDGSYERARAVPSVANFTLQNPNSGTLLDGAEKTGMILNSVNSTAGIRMARLNGAPPSLPYTIITRSQPLGANGNSYPAAIILRNSTTGRLIIFGAYNYNQELVQSWSSYTSFNANILSPSTIWSAGDPLWRKVEVTSTTITFSLSVDGRNWYVVATTTMAAYITSIDEIGMGMFVSGGIAAAAFQSWEVF